jgi:hypothetical protein
MRDGKKERTKEGRKEGRKKRMRDSTWVGGGGKGAGNMVISGPTNRELMSEILPATPPPSRQCSTFVVLKMQGLDLNLFFFFAKNYDYLTISNKCRDFGRCFGLNLSKIFSKNCNFLYFRSLVGYTVAVGGPTNKSGCLPTSAAKAYQQLISLKYTINYLRNLYLCMSP